MTLNSIHDSNKELLAPSTKKRKREDIAISNGKRVKVSTDQNVRYPFLEKRIDPIKEYHRDVTFELGAQLQESDLQERLLELNISPFKKLEENKDVLPEILTSQETLLLTKLKKNCDKLATSLLYELFLILRQSGSYHKEIRKYAIELVKSTEKKPTTITPQSLNQKYLDEARAGLELFGVELSNHEEKIQELAMKLQAEELSDEENFSDEDIDENLDFVINQLGELLYLAENDIKSTRNCVKAESTYEMTDNIKREVMKSLQIKRRHLHNACQAYHKTKLQNADEATFHIMSVEISKLLLLKSGSINVGLIETIKKHFLLPEYRHLSASKNLENVLDNLKENSDIWNVIYDAKPPESKESPANDLIRATLGQHDNNPITKRDAQIVILSALFGHPRQTNTGSCFTTCILIDFMNKKPESLTYDFSQLVETGSVSRMVFLELRKSPFQLRTHNDSLDTRIFIDEFFNIIKTEDYKEPKEIAQKQKLGNEKLWKAPGLKAACRALELTDCKKAIMEVIKTIGKQNFVVHQILKKLALIAYEKQQDKPYNLRSQTRYSLEKLKEKALYAFGAQTHNPLYIAWEQGMSTIVNWLGSQYSFPHLVYESMVLSLELPKKAEHPHGYLKRLYKGFLKEMHLPMIIRMRYRYNHFFDDRLNLFNNDLTEDSEGHHYGYELCDGGLPKDFAFSKELINDLNKESSMIKLERFEEYPPTSSWKPINTQEKFQSFLIDVIQQTLAYLKYRDKGEKAKNWKKIADILIKKIRTKKFITDIITLMFDRPSQSRELKTLKKNKYIHQTTPWKLRWGGSCEHIMQTYFNFNLYPIKDYKHRGDAKSTLAWTLRYIVKQTEENLNVMRTPGFKTPINSTCHAFLLAPNNPSFKSAWESLIDEPQKINNFIKEHIEVPGENISKALVPKSTKQKLIQYLANNMWTNPADERHDYNRQQLTEFSKTRLDEKMKQIPKSLSLEDFEKALFKAVCESRKEDPKIKERNIYWERDLNKALKIKLKQYANLDRPQAKNMLYNFARNRQDTVYFSKKEKQLIYSKMKPSLVKNQTIKEFRNELVKTLHDIRKNYTGRVDNHLINKIKPRIDTKIYQLLPKKAKEVLHMSLIVPYDANWKEGLEYVYLGYVVNPSTAKLELVNVYIDNNSNRIAFRNQGPWFRKGINWNLPGNFYKYHNESFFPLKKALGMVS